MQFLHFKGELSLQDDLIIELMPSTDCRILGTWEFGKWMEVQSIDNEAKQIQRVGPNESEEWVGEKLRDSHNVDTRKSCWLRTKANTGIGCSGVISWDKAPSVSITPSGTDIDTEWREG
jgi:hypothetical protein